MKSKRSIGVQILCGFGLMTISLAFDTVTLVNSKEYRYAIATSVVFVVLADAFLVRAFLRATTKTGKAISLFLMLPTLFLVADYARRLPYVFK